METEVKMSRWEKGWAMAKSSWRVLKLDKELATLPLLGMVACLVVLIPYALLVWVGTIIIHGANGSFSASYNTGHWGVLIPISFYLLMSLVTSFFAAALIRGALDRFEGKDPTVKSSLAGAWRRKGSIAAFTLLSSTIGYVLGFLEQKLPLGGKIAGWLAGMAWGIATFFALPVIVMSDQPVGPMEAVKTSAGTIKKVWGEAFVAQLGVGLVGSLMLLIYTAAMASVGVVAFALVQHPIAVFAGVGVLWFLGFVAMAFIFGVLGAIAKAAVYHYAKTGESPVEFNKDLLRAAMTPKKARKIFV